MIYGRGGTKELTRNIDVPEEDRQRFCLTDDEILELASFAVTIEDYYSKKSGHDMPMDIEWAKDGESGELFIVQSRPETVQSQGPWTCWRPTFSRIEGAVLSRRDERWFQDRVGKGPGDQRHEPLPEFRPGEILVSTRRTRTGSPS